MLQRSKSRKVCALSDMQENMWARLRDSRPSACLIHEIKPAYFPAFLYECRLYTQQQRIPNSPYHAHKTNNS